MAAWLSGDVLTNGIKIHYYRTGGRKPPVVLLHGITDYGLYWSRVARALEADYDLIMVDARGHGHSEVPESGYSPQDHAADVAGLIQALGLRQPVLVGHSMGAANAAATAALYPERVGGAALEDPPWRDEANPRTPRISAEEWQAQIVANRSKSIPELIEVCRVEHATWHEEDCRFWAESHQLVSPQVVGFIPSVRTPWQETARCMVCPVLLITGDVEAGAIVTPETAKEAVALWQSGRSVHIAGAGHSIHREQLDKFVEVVRDFLADRGR